MKQLKRWIKGGVVVLIQCCVVFFGTAASAQQPPNEAFDPDNLDEAARDAYYFQLLPFQVESLLNSSAGRYVTISTASYAAQYGISEESAMTMEDPETPGEIIVGTIDCNIQAHNPHIGNSSGTVKAKASGDCTFTPTGKATPPPESQTTWRLRMLLLRLLPGEDFLGTVAASGTFPKTGFMVRWFQDYGENGGTQVDSLSCINARYINAVVVNLEVPEGWNVRPTSVVGGSATPRIRIAGCP